MMSQNRIIFPALLLGFAFRVFVACLETDAAAGEAAHDQTVQNRFKHRSWTYETGLPHDEVLSLLQSGNGYIWVGTRKGLARFDGTHFETYTRLTHSQFENDYCASLAEYEGSLWIGTEEGPRHL